jgi:hypothetical protein
MCGVAQTGAGCEPIVQSCRHTAWRGETMKHNALRSRQITKLPIAWRATEYAALRANAADTFDDRVSENIFDIEDERAEVDNIAYRIARDED